MQVFMNGTCMISLILRCGTELRYWTIGFFEIYDRERESKCLALRGRFFFKYGMIDLLGLKDTRCAICPRPIIFLYVHRTCTVYIFLSFKQPTQEMTYEISELYM